jgi:hypothetical protein
MENKTPSQSFETAKTYVNVLSYEEKINLQEWLDGQIRKEMAAHNQKVVEENMENLGSFLNKAKDTLGKTGNSLKDNFNSAFGNK